ncbi:MAG: hypothetical protein ACJ8R9_05440 [Steroidobacteraceae bacterium]
MTERDQQSRRAPSNPSCIQQAIEALEPFADIGQWLFARDLPDDTPMVEVRGINEFNWALTRGEFKAAHTALQALRSAHETPQVRCTHFSGKHTLQCTWCNWPSENVTNGPSKPDETAAPQPDLDAVAKALEPFGQVGGLLFFSQPDIPDDTPLAEILGHNGAFTRGQFKAANLAWRSLQAYDNSLGSSHPEHLFKAPQPDEFVAPNHHRYQGRDFYGEHAQELAEVHYLRDWKRWAEPQLRAFVPWARSINEALNSTNESHKP